MSSEHIKSPLFSCINRIFCNVKTIKENNINKNWNSIESELDNLYDEKILKFQKEYQEFAEFEIYSEINKQFIIELNQSKPIIILILSELKKAEDITDYRIAIRQISAAMDKTKKNMQRIINEIIN